MATGLTTALPRRSAPLEPLTGSGPRRLAFGAAVVLVELLLAFALVSGRLSVALLAFLGVAVLAFAFAYPMAIAVATLVLAVSIFHDAWFSFSVGPLDANGAELLLGALFVVALTRPRRRAWGGFAGAALAAFLALLLFSAALAVEGGDANPFSVFAWSRAFFFFAFFYVVVRLFSDRGSLARLLAWASVIAAVTGFVALALSLWSGPGSILQDPSQQFIRSEEGLGIIERVRLPGLSLAYALFWYAVVRAIRGVGRARLLWGLAIAGMFVNIAVSFNRNMWIGLSLGLIAMVLLGGPLVRRRLLIGIGVAGVALSLLVAQAGTDSRISPLVARGTSLTDPEKLESEASLRSREIETEVAWRVARESPLVGIGPGVDFGVSFWEATPGGVWVRVQQLFLHNQYLYLWLIAGLPALLAFLAYLVRSLRDAWWWRLRTPESAALGVGLAAIMLSAIVAIYFSVPDMILSISLATAAIFATVGRASPAGGGGDG